MRTPAFDACVFAKQLGRLDDEIIGSGGNSRFRRRPNSIRSGPPVGRALPADPSARTPQTNLGRVFLREDQGVKNIHGHHERLQLVVAVLSFTENLQKKVQLRWRVNHQRRADLPKSHRLSPPAKRPDRSPESPIAGDLSRVANRSTDIQPLGRAQVFRPLRGGFWDTRVGEYYRRFSQPSRRVSGCTLFVYTCILSGAVAISHFSWD